MDDDLDYELSQLDLSVFDQEFNLLSNSDAPPILDIDIDDTELIPKKIVDSRYYPIAKTNRYQYRLIQDLHMYGLIRWESKQVLFHILNVQG